MQQAYILLWSPAIALAIAGDHNNFADVAYFLFLEADFIRYHKDATDLTTDKPIRLLKC